MALIIIFKWSEVFLVNINHCFGTPSLHFTHYKSNFIIYLMPLSLYIYLHITNFLSRKMTGPNRKNLTYVNRISNLECFIIIISGRRRLQSSWRGDSMSIRNRAHKCYISFIIIESQRVNQKFRNARFWWQNVSCLFHWDTEAIGHSSFCGPEICHRSSPSLCALTLTYYISLRFRFGLIGEHKSNNCERGWWGDFKIIDKWQLLLLIYDGLGNGLFIRFGCEPGLFSSFFGLVNQRLWLELNTSW